MPPQRIKVRIKINKKYCWLLWTEVGWTLQIRNLPGDRMLNISWDAGRKLKKKMLTGTLRPQTRDDLEPE